MWGQLSNLGQALKEQAEAAASVAREAGLDRQLVSIVATLYNNACFFNCVWKLWEVVNPPNPAQYAILHMQDQARSQVGTQLGSLLSYEGQGKSPGKSHVCKR